MTDVQGGLPYAPGAAVRVKDTTDLLSVSERTPTRISAKGSHTAPQNGSKAGHVSEDRRPASESTLDLKIFRIETASGIVKKAWCLARGVVGGKTTWSMTFLIQ